MMSSFLMWLSISISSMIGLASEIFIFFFSTLWWYLPNFARCWAIVSTFCSGSLTWISNSIVMSSSCPSRRCSRHFPMSSLLWPTRLRRIFSSTVFAICLLSFLRSFCLVTLIETSTKSRMIWSTSLPWKPISVNFVASTLMNGLCESFESLRAISVLPTPVGPTIRIFFGITSSRRSSGRRCLRQRLRYATATVFFASFCPTM
mmetsp:Transcript_34744/g.64319  ORF Transcript_34744/g.64319 Transcript_34744/m.64319 type:complete len:204 (-) Transcript_34744:71-682(-)